MIPEMMTREEAYRLLDRARPCSQNGGPRRHDDTACETPHCWEFYRLAGRVIELENAVHDAREPDPSGSACDRCGRRDGLDAVLSDTAWAVVSGLSDGGGFLCLWCIDALAAERGIVVGLEVTLHFAGRVLRSAPPQASDDSAQERTLRWVEELIEQHFGTGKGLRTTPACEYEAQIRSFRSDVRHYALILKASS